MAKHEKFYQSRSVIDCSTGYGADSFLQNHQGGDPWAELCFVSFVEAFTNHPIVSYPFPSHHSARDNRYQGLSNFMFELQKAGLLQGAEKVVAEEIVLEQSDLENDFSCFRSWVIANRPIVKRWIDFHHQPDIKKKHKTQMPFIVNDAVQEFFDRNRLLFTSLAKAVPTGPKRLLYTFDVVCRGRQYALLVGGASNYYSHPIREPVLQAAEKSRTTAENAFSWGRYLAGALQNDRLSNNVSAIIDVLGNLKITIGKLGAGATQLSLLNESDRRKCLMEVAAEAGLPATLRDDVHKQIENFFSIMHLLTAPFHWPSIHFSLAVGSFVANKVSQVPGCVPRALPFFRGLVQYPHLLADEAVHGIPNKKRPA
jgi:hypothetical protein